MHNEGTPQDGVLPTLLKQKPFYMLVDVGDLATDSVVLARGETYGPGYGHLIRIALAA